MIREGRIGVQEAICMLTITITTRVFYTSPGVLAKSLGTTGWYMTLISAAVGAVGFTFIYLLLKKFPDRNIVEIFNTVLGRSLGLVVCMLLSTLFLINAASMLREFTEVMKVYILALSPVSYIAAIFIFCLTIVSFMGLETVARFSKLISFLLLTLFLIVILLSWQNYEFYRITPILGHGLKKTVTTGFARSTVYADVIILGIIAGSLQGVQHIKKVGYVSIALSGILISVNFLSFSLTFPYYINSELTAPMYQMASLLDFGRFFQRIEALFLFVWIMGAFISVTVNFYAFISTYCKVFEIQDTKPVIIPSSIILLSLTLIPKSISELAYGYVSQFRQYGWTVFYLPPVIALIAASMRKMGRKVKNA